MGTEVGRIEREFVFKSLADSNAGCDVHGSRKEARCTFYAVHDETLELAAAGRGPQRLRDRGGGPCLLLPAEQLPHVCLEGSRGRRETPDRGAAARHLQEPAAEVRAREAGGRDPGFLLFEGKERRAELPEERTVTSPWSRRRVSSGVRFRSHPGSAQDLSGEDGAPRHRKRHRDASGQDPPSLGGEDHRPTRQEPLDPLHRGRLSHPRSLPGRPHHHQGRPGSSGAGGRRAAPRHHEPARPTSSTRRRSSRSTPSCGRRCCTTSTPSAICGSGTPCSGERESRAS